MSRLNGWRKTEPRPALMFFSVCAADDQLDELFTREGAKMRAHLLHSVERKLIAT